MADHPIKSPDDLPQYEQKQARIDATYILPADVKSQDFRDQLLLAVLDACQRGLDSHIVVAADVTADSRGVELRVSYKALVEDFPDAGGRW
jgi:hypothetical protein